LLQIAEEDLNGSGKIHATVLHVSAEELAGIIFNEIAAYLEPIELFKAGLSPIVEIHTGPGTAGSVITLRGERKRKQVASRDQRSCSMR